MATVKVKFRQSSVEGSEGSIYYQVLKDRVPRQISTTFKVFPNEWDFKRGRVVIPKNSEREEHLINIRELIRKDISRINKIIQMMDDRGIEYSGEDVCDEFHLYSRKLSLVNYMTSVIARLKQNGKIATASHYKTALNSFMRFLSSRGDDDIMMDNISSEILVDFESYLQASGIRRNTSSAYMRNLQTAYNKAVEEGLICQSRPFRHVYTGVDKTIKRAVGLNVIASIKSLDLSEYPNLDFARDMFVLSFYFRGMSFVDMSFLKKSDLKGNQITYYRRKTGQCLNIKWTHDMQAIVEKYPENSSDFLLPIIKNKGVNEYYAYRNVAAKVNRNLKKVGEMVGCEISLTHYVARHSWATGAQSQKIPIKIISKGMGHDSELTTQIYLASIGSSVVDDANDKIIKSLV